MTTPNPSVTYANYLQLDQLLSLQRPRADGSERLRFGAHSAWY